MRNSFIYLCLILLALSIAGSAQNSNYRLLNRDRAGQRIRIEDYTKRGKLTIVEFFSDQSEPCRTLSSKLATLADKNPELHIGRVDIDRPAQQQIDWRSPLATQYRVTSVPYLQIYDAQGKLLAEGIPARRKVFELLRESNLL